MNFGQFIKAKRIEKGMPQAELASELKISAQYLSDIERGNRLPSDYYFLDELACLIGCSGDYLCYLAGILPRDIADMDLSAEKVSSVFKDLRER
jgi:transcriptional regulator with XRE-family HTH domain